VIYFAQLPGGSIKIGTTNDVDARLSGLANHYGTELALLATMPGDRSVEAEMHERFSHLRLGSTGPNVSTGQTAEGERGQAMKATRKPVTYAEHVALRKRAQAATDALSALMQQRAYALLDLPTLKTAETLVKKFLAVNHPGSIRAAEHLISVYRRNGSHLRDGSWRCPWLTDGGNGPS
jgi:hypothetical protein